MASFERVPSKNLSQHEEVSKGRNTESNSNAEDEEANKVGSTSCVLQHAKNKKNGTISFPKGNHLVCETANRGDEASTSRAWDSQGHNAGEQELTR